MSPDQRSFENDLISASFRLGEVEGKWLLSSVDWPYALLQIFAKDQSAYGFRFDCTNYPAFPPTARLLRIPVPVSRRFWESVSSFK